MLSGGHAAVLVLTPEHPLLAQLLRIVAPQANDLTVHRLPPRSSRFPSRADGHRSPSQAINWSASSRIRGAGATGHDVAPAAPKIIRHPFVQLEAFLTDDEVQWLRDIVLPRSLDSSRR